MNAQGWPETAVEAIAFTREGLAKESETAAARRAMAAPTRQRVERIASQFLCRGLGHRNVPGGLAPCLDCSGAVWAAMRAEHEPTGPEAA